jgi:hypothetical protein
MTDLASSSVASLAKFSLTLTGLGAIKAWQSQNRAKNALNEIYNDTMTRIDTPSNCYDRRFNSLTTKDLINELKCRVRRPNDSNILKVTQDDCNDISIIANIMCGGKYKCLSDENYKKIFEDANNALVATAMWSVLSGLGVDALKTVLIREFNVSPTTLNNVIEAFHGKQMDPTSMGYALASGVLGSAVGAVTTIALPVIGISMLKDMNTRASKEYKEMFNKVLTKYYAVEKKYEDIVQDAENKAAEATQTYNSERERLQNEYFEQWENERENQKIQRGQNTSININGTQVPLNNIKDAKSTIRGIASEQLKPQSDTIDELRSQIKTAKETVIVEKGRLKDLILGIIEKSKATESDTDPVAMILNQTQELSELFSGLLFEPVDDFEIQKIYDKIFPAQAMARTFVEGTQSLGRDIKQGTTSLAQKAVERTSALTNRAYESARAAPSQMSQAFNPLTEHITTGTQDMRNAASSRLQKVSNFFGNIGNRGGKKNKRTKHLRKNKTQKRKKRTHTRR